jgi:hypothetical protein
MRAEARVVPGSAEHLAIFVRGKEDEAQPVTDEMRALYLEARSKVGTLDFSVVAGPAEVLVDGVYVGTGPFAGPLFVEPGQHAVEARLTGRTKVAVVGVKEGQTLRIMMNFGVESGHASVSIVDKERQDWDGVAAKPSGFVPEGNDAAAEMVEADPTTAPAVAAPAQGAVVGREGQPNSYLVAGGAATGGAAVGTGVALAFLSAATASDADELLAQLKAGSVRCSRPPQAGGCAELLLLRKEQDRLANTAMAALIGGGILLAATAAYTFWPRPAAKPATSLRLVPVVVPHSGGVWVAGAF